MPEEESSGHGAVGGPSTDGAQTFLTFGFSQWRKLPKVSDLTGLAYPHFKNSPRLTGRTEMSLNMNTNCPYHVPDSQEVLRIGKPSTESLGEFPQRAHGTEQRKAGGKDIISP